MRGSDGPLFRCGGPVLQAAEIRQLPELPHLAHPSLLHLQPIWPPKARGKHQCAHRKIRVRLFVGLVFLPVLLHERAVHTKAADYGRPVYLLLYRVHREPWPHPEHLSSFHLDDHPRLLAVLNSPLLRAAEISQRPAAADAGNLR